MTIHYASECMFLKICSEKQAGTFNIKAVELWMFLYSLCFTAFS